MPLAARRIDTPRFQLKRSRTACRWLAAARRRQEVAFRPWNGDTGKQRKTLRAARALLEEPTPQRMEKLAQWAPKLPDAFALPDISWQENLACEIKFARAHHTRKLVRKMTAALSEAGVVVAEHPNHSIPVATSYIAEIDIGGLCQIGFVLPPLSFDLYGFATDAFLYVSAAETEVVHGIAQHEFEHMFAYQLCIEGAFPNEEYSARLAEAVFVSPSFLQPWITVLRQYNNPKDITAVMALSRIEGKLREQLGFETLSQLADLDPEQIQTIARRLFNEAYEKAIGIPYDALLAMT